jgi:hypothetical protein
VQDRQPVRLRENTPQHPSELDRTFSAQYR